LNCFRSGNIGAVHLQYVVTINPDKHTVIFHWTGCDPQHSVHTSTIRAGSVFSTSGHTYAGCRGYLGTVTSLKIS
jgi:hypothetical protein